MNPATLLSRIIKSTAIVLVSAACSCNLKPLDLHAHIDVAGTNLVQRINAPDGYIRVAVDSNSFGSYLRNLPLKPDGSLVHQYNGVIKKNNNVYVAVVDLPIGLRDLQQCADAVMHLRAEYLYAQHRQEEIHFTFTNGFRAGYNKWMQGYRIAVTGNNAEWVATEAPGDSREIFDKYLEVVYAYCGSQSLSKELKHIDYSELRAGDVLVKGGLPGHAEIVLDVAANKTGKKLFLLAQSSMPAQDIQVLANRGNTRYSPWYELDPDDKEVNTPEFRFTTGQLMRFENSHLEDN